MDWMQVILFLATTVGSWWLMHRENAREMKDFHGRLCRLEEKYILMMERMLEKKGN